MKRPAERNHSHLSNRIDITCRTLLSSTLLNKTSQRRFLSIRSYQHDNNLTNGARCKRFNWKVSSVRKSMNFPKCTRSRIFSEMFVRHMRDFLVLHRFLLRHECPSRLSSLPGGFGILLLWFPDIVAVHGEGYI